MTVTAYIIVLLGLSIMISRAPLAVAPEKTRNTYISLFDTPGKMRIMGIVMGLFAALIAWGVWADTIIATLVVKYVAFLVLALALLAMIPFPAFSSRLAMTVWRAFPPPVLRVMGVLAVIIGGLIVWYGFSL